MSFNENRHAVRDRWELVRLRLQRPVAPPSAIPPRPAAPRGPDRLVSTERFIHEIERAFYEMEDLLRFERSMRERIRKRGTSPHLVKQINRDFTAFAKLYDRSTDIFEREFLVLCPAEQRLRPLRDVYVQYLENARRWTYASAAALMYSARGDSDHYREFSAITDRHRREYDRIVHEMVVIVRELKSSHPEFFENLGFPEEWIEAIWRRIRQKSFDFNPSHFPGVAATAMRRFAPCNGRTTPPN